MWASLAINKGVIILFRERFIFLGMLLLSYEITCVVAVWIGEVWDFFLAFLVIALQYSTQSVQEKEENNLLIMTADDVRACSLFRARFILCLYSRCVS